MFALQKIGTIEIQQQHNTYAKYYYDMETKDNWMLTHRNGQYRYTEKSLHINKNMNMIH
jgi:hypothetical protein